MMGFASTQRKIGQHEALGRSAPSYISDGQILVSPRFLQLFSFLLSRFSVLVLPYGTIFCSNYCETKDKRQRRGSRGEQQQQQQEQSSETDLANHAPGKIFRLGALGCGRTETLSPPVTNI